MLPMLRGLVISFFAATLVIGITSSIALAETATAEAPQFALLASFPSSTMHASPVASWTHSGCWSPRTGAPCVDVYRDQNGQLWICKACGQTGNPSPGKCRKTTQSELDGGRWCS